MLNIVVRYAFHTVGRALWITTVVLVAGFSVLAMSSFRLNADMGQLSAIVIFIALVVDFYSCQRYSCVLIKQHMSSKQRLKRQKHKRRKTLRHRCD